MIEEALLLDSTALASLHAESNKPILEFILIKHEAHISILSLYEYLSALGYFSEVDFNKLYRSIEKIYNIVGVDQQVILKAAELDSTLTKVGVFLNSVDLIVAATAIVRSMVLVTAKPELYRDLPKFGLKLLSVEDLCEIIRQEIEEYVE
ncbi:MAG: PIN domain-containing protein [Nitrososphaerota archaeon]